MHRHILALALASGVAASGCSWNAWTPGAEPADPEALAPSQARLLTLDEPQTGEISCDEGFCQQWYRLDVPRPGTLRIDAKPLTDAPPMARIVLHDGLGHVLARKTNDRDGRPLQIAFPWVEGNVAAILVQSGKGRFPYSLTASLE
jgi:hypothetical protein